MAGKSSSRISFHLKGRLGYRILGRVFVVTGSYTRLEYFCYILMFISVGISLLFAFSPLVK